MRRRAIAARRSGLHRAFSRPPTPLLALDRLLLSWRGSSSPPLGLELCCTALFTRVSGLHVSRLSCFLSAGATRTFTLCLFFVFFFLSFFSCAESLILGSHGCGSVRWGGGGAASRSRAERPQRSSYPSTQAWCRRSLSQSSSSSGAGRGRCWRDGSGRAAATLFSRGCRGGASGFVASLRVPARAPVSLAGLPRQPSRRERLKRRLCSNHRCRG